MKCGSATRAIHGEIIVPFELDLELNNVVFTVPQRGDKKKLLDLSILNVKQYKADRLKQAEKLNPEQRSMRLLKEIQNELHLDKPPLQIECFEYIEYTRIGCRSCLRSIQKGRNHRRKITVNTILRRSWDRMITLP